MILDMRKYENVDFLRNTTVFNIPANKSYINLLYRPDCIGMGEQLDQ